MSEFYTVLHDDNGSFVDHSFSAKNFGTDNFSFQLIAAEDYLYIGFRKKFNVFYVELATANTAANTFTAEYYNGTAWTAIPTFNDETLGFTRSGFFTLEKPTDSDTGRHLWEKATVDGNELFFIRLRPSVDHTATIARGLGIVFANDQDLIEERGNIVSKHAPSGGTWILKHVSARKDIVQAFRNQGNRKINERDAKLFDASVVRYKDLTEFDFLDFAQVRRAATYLALSKIFTQELSDREDDKWAMLGKDFYNQYAQAINVFALSLDADDDGELDSNEENALQRVNLTWK